MAKATSHDARLRSISKMTIALVLLLAACHPLRGCAESEFTLAADSRLPKWFQWSPAQRRSDFTVTLTYYPAPLVGSQRLAELTLQDAKGHTLQRVVATLKGSEPLTLDESYAGKGPIPYPIYEVLTANGITDVVEHRRMEPVFNVTDDREVRRKLGVDQW